MKIYIAGKITDNPEYKRQFAEAEKYLRELGHTPMSPAVLPNGFEHYEYMRICYSMIDVCEGVYFLSNWQDSAGANMEHTYARQWRKKIVYQEEQAS